MLYFPGLDPDEGGFPYGTSTSARFRNLEISGFEVTISKSSLPDLYRASRPKRLPAVF